MGQAWGRNDVQGMFVGGREAGDHCEKQNQRLSCFLLSVPLSCRLAPHFISVKKLSHRSNGLSLK